MKNPQETEEKFLLRIKAAEAKGEVVFRDDANREFILDLIDEYMDITDAIMPNEEL